MGSWMKKVWKALIYTNESMQVSNLLYEDNSVKMAQQLWTSRESSKQIRHSPREWNPNITACERIYWSMHAVHYKALIATGWCVFVSSTDARQRDEIILIFLLSFCNRVQFFNFNYFLIMSTAIKEQPSSKGEEAGAVSPPDGGARAWIVMVGAFLCNGILFGVINTYSVIYMDLRKKLEAQGETDTSSKAGMN